METVYYPLNLQMLKVIMLKSYNSYPKLLNLHE